MQRNWYGRGITIEKTWEERMRLLAAVAAGIMLCLLVIVSAFTTLLSSFRNITSAGDIWAAPFVGFVNYAAVLSTNGTAGALGYTLLLGLLTGALTGALVTGAHFALRDIADARLRFALAGIAFLPWIFPVTDIPHSLHILFPQMNASAALLYCALYQAILAVPFILAAILTLEQAVGEIGIPAVILAAFGLGWYAGVQNLSVQQSLLVNQSTMTLWMLQGAGGSQAELLIRVTAQGAIAKLGLFALIPLAAALFLGEVSPTDRTRPIFTRQPFFTYLPALPTALLAVTAVILPFAATKGLQAEGIAISATQYIAGYIRLLSPIPGLLLGGALAFIIEGRRDVTKLLISLGVTLVLSELCRLSFSQYLFRGSYSVPEILPPLDFHWAAVMGFAIMAVCLPYWREKNSDNQISRCVFLALCCMILIGITHMNDPMQATTVVGNTAPLPYSAVSRSSFAQIGFGTRLLSSIVNLVLVAGGVSLLALSMHRVDVVSSLRD